MPENVLILSLHHSKVFICRLFELNWKYSKNVLTIGHFGSSFLQSLHWLPIEKRILFKLIVQAFKAFQFSSPGYLASYFQSRVHKTKYSLRSDLAITFEVPRAKKQAGDRAFSVAGPHLWNGLPSSVRIVDHMDRFKNKLKSHLFSWFFQAPWAHCKRRYINHIIIIIIIIYVPYFDHKLDKMTDVLNCFHHCLK